MKKIILLLTALILSFAMFTGCQHNTTPEHNTTSEPDKYPRNIIFNKETFDAKQQAWNNSGIKDYQFSQVFYHYKILICRTTVKNGEVAGREFFWYKSGMEKDPYELSDLENFFIYDSDPIESKYKDNPVDFDDYVTINPNDNLTYQQKKEIFENPKFIDYKFLKAKDNVPYSKIDDVYSVINSWYKDYSSKDFKAEEIAQALIEVKYMKQYPVPTKFGAVTMDESRYDQELELVVPLPLEHPCWGDKIFDFKVIEN